MKAIKMVLTYTLIMAVGVMFIIPLMWMLTVSLSDPATVAEPGLHIIPKHLKWANDNWFYSVFLTQWLHIVPRQLEWKNYSTALTMMPFAKYAWNTIRVTLISVLGGLLSCSMVAYAFARLKAPGKDALFILMLSTIMLPALVTMIPMFIIFKTLGWYDTLLPLIVPAWFGNAFYIFLMRQFFLTIPVGLEEAAKIDGCGPFRIFWQIMLPLSKPVLVSVAVFSFVAHWNDFMNPLIYLNSVDNRTLALGLATFTDVWGVDIVSLMAASTAVLLPVLIIFFLAQRYFVQGVVMSGIKG